MKVTLLNPSQIPPYSGGPIRPRGYMADVSQNVADQLASFGFVDLDSVNNASSQSTVDVESDAPVVEDVPEVKPARGKLSRPKQVASVAVWREYAESLGLKITGMSKQEIIGAVDAAEK